MVLADLSRQALRRQLSYELAPRGRLLAWFLSPDLAEAVRESIVRTPSGSFLRLEPRLAEEVRELAAHRVGAEAAVLSFNAQGTVTPNTLYDSDPSKSNVGTITINFPQGGQLDLVSTGAVRSKRPRWCGSAGRSPRG